MGGLIAVGGWHGLEYINYPGRLLVFEPTAEAFAELQRNLAGNPNTTLVNKAVGSTSGTATIYKSVPSHSSSLLAPRGAVQADHHVYFDGTEEVAVTTLDDEKPAGFDVLRIDTQGYELEVLRGATKTLQKLKRVEVELHDANTYPGAAQLADLDAFMAEQGWMQTANDVEGSDGLGDVTYEPQP